MVHALSEIQRVLAPDGILIDLRPLLDEWPLEVVTTSDRQKAGRAVDLAEPLSDDKAANQAVSEIEKRGWFVREQEETFPFNYYWDTPKEMQEYLEETWDDVISVEKETWDRLKSLWAVANADARARIQLKILITRWKKNNTK